MRFRSLVLTLVLSALTLVGAAGADAQKGGPATVLNGGRGVVSPDGNVRYVALTAGRYAPYPAPAERPPRGPLRQLVRGFLLLTLRGRGKDTRRAATG